MSAALEADGMSRHARKSLAKGKRPKAKRGLPDLDHSKSAVLDSPRSRESKRGIGMRSMSSFSGTARNLAYRSAKWWSRDSGYFSRIGISPPAQSMDDLPQFDG